MRVHVVRPVNLGIVESHRRCNKFRLRLGDSPSCRDDGWCLLPRCRVPLVVVHSRSERVQKCQ